ncbi:MAG: hypothetical protein AAGG44_04900 [Planctomycetota bacterium]
MTRSNRTLAVVCVLAGMLASDPGYLAAQEFETSYNARFQRDKPMVGKPMPEVQMFDSSGRPFRLTSAEDKYTVVVFGCLT